MNAFTQMELVYALGLAGMLLGSAHGKAPLRHYLVAPVIAIPLFIVSGLVCAIVNPFVDATGIDPGSVFNLVFDVPLIAAIGYGVSRLLAAYATGSSAPRHLRGAVVSALNLISGRGSPAATSLTLAGIPIAPGDETKHFKIIGTTGTGKSTAIQEILAAALSRGDRAIIADPDGGYLNRFYDPDRDVILNPFDPDARKWDLFGEITNDYDVEQLARSLIPDRGGEDRVWSGYARTVFSAVVQQTISVNIKSDAQLVRLLVHAPLKELRKLLPQTSAAPFLEEGNEKMFSSVRSVAASAIDALKYTVQHKAEPLSVRQWVRQGAARQNGGRGGVLFIPYRAGEIAALASMISAWMRLGIFEAMDREEGDQHLWFVVDELDALGAIDGLKDALARLRKFGGRCILGFQSIAQVSGTYGKSVAETLVENCGNTLILRCSASEHGGTSEFASKLIGQREVIHTTYSKSRRDSEWIPSVTSNQQLRIEPAVMASEIERLPDLSGFLKLVSIPDWFMVKLVHTTMAGKPRPRRPVPPPPPEPTPASPPIPALAPPEPDKPDAPLRPTRRKASEPTSRPKAKAKRARTPGSRNASPMPPPSVGPDSTDPGSEGMQSPPGGAESNN
jgi:hypothetical protein